MALFHLRQIKRDKSAFRQREYEMKKIRITCLSVLMITLLIMGINILIMPLSDWIVRIDGIIMLICIAIVRLGII